MKENSNSILIFNTFILYVRLLVILFCGLLSTRFALSALGEMDFGLFAIVGSLVIFISIINSTMTGTCNRFLAATIGKGNEVEQTRKVFNVNLVIQSVIAIATLILAIPLGTLYIKHYINYDGNIDNAITVFYISIFTSAISFIGVPYNALLLAKERFYVFCSADIFFWIIRVILCYLLMFHFTDKLFSYALITAFTIIIPVMINYVYCRVYFPHITQLKIVKGRHHYTEVLSFSAWVGYGAVIQIGREQATPILINFFFNTVINAAYSVSNQIKAGINMFASNLSKPISPQITKSYVAGNIVRCTQLMIMSSKLSFLFMLIVSSPFLACPGYILSLWLHEVPTLSASFTRLMIVDCLISSLNMGIAEYVFASGNIKHYQFWTNTIYLLSIIISFVFLLSGASVLSVMYIAISASAVTVLVRQCILYKVFRFDNMILIKGSYIPALIVTLLFIPSIFIKYYLPSYFCIAIIPVYTTLLVYFIGITKEEKGVIVNSISKNIFHKK